MNNAWNAAIEVSNTVRDLVKESKKTGLADMVVIGFFSSVTGVVAGYMFKSEGVGLVVMNLCLSFFNLLIIREIWKVLKSFKKE